MGGVDIVLSHVLKRWTLIIFGLGVVLAPPPPHLIWLHSSAHSNFLLSLTSHSLL